MIVFKWMYTSKIWNFQIINQQRKISFFLALFYWFLLLFYHRACLRDHWLAEKGFQSWLYSFVGLNFLNRSLDSELCKLFFLDQKVPQSFFVNVLFPFEFVILSHFWIFEQWAGFFVRKILFFGNDELWSLWIFVFFFTMLKNIFDWSKFFNKLVSLDWTDSFNFGGIITATKDAHINEFLVSKS